MVSQSPNGTIEFAFYRPGARSVRVAGDFNLWDPTRHELCEETSDGWWRMSVDLAPGEYRFKYVVDGHLWEADFAAYGVEADRNGDWNGIMLVEDAANLAQTPLMIETDEVMQAVVSDEAATDIDREDEYTHRRAA